MKLTGVRKRSEMKLGASQRLDMKLIGVSMRSDMKLDKHRNNTLIYINVGLKIR